MIFRLLYRLLLQRFHRRQEAKPALAISPWQQTIGYRDKYRIPVVWFTSVVAFAGLLALAWQILELPSPGIMIKADHAELHLQIASSTSWPLVVYLQGTDLPPPESPTTPPETSRLKSIDGIFAPAFQVLQPASTIEIINSDAIAHNTHVFNRGDTIFNVALPLPGVSVKKTLTGFGIFSVRCDLHPWMRAWLFVPPSRYYAVLYKPSTIRFSNLLPGQYVLNLWQADSPERPSLISLTAGETKTLRLN